MRICRRTTAVLLVAALATPTVALAQQNPPAPAQQPDPPAPVRSATSSTPRTSSDSDTTLPVSLERIRRELIHQVARSTNLSRGLDIRYYVEVYGQAPQIQIFSPDTDLVHGPVPYGGMTHQEFLNLVTPQEFRAPPADLTMLPMLLAKWLAERQNNKKKTESEKPQ